ncbi:hypothetical protein [Kibdelosporangium phytohabitans]|uniref:Uncharacterized protein n=1 Tax=Kibdelosporangium phytohabitans TaxID=860235 RepID=A0A0N9IBU5_9PSEU|nr:hypothetical protein [Kibdelosporangium phytohabitans]ALG13812.1 hypothetical protein AOZ06_49325 [Kibdelosporangium phytohabitans]MBE1467262.1 hypothetical protein [Kibdelosporangium phytohabitans]
MYSYEILPEARDQVDGLAAAALPYYAELIAFLELTPWDALPYRDDNPDGNLRKALFGPAADGIAVYLVLEDQRRVVVVSVTWVD